MEKQEINSGDFVIVKTDDFAIKEEMSAGINLHKMYIVSEISYGHVFFYDENGSYRGRPIGNYELAHRSDFEENKQKSKNWGIF